MSTAYTIEHGDALSVLQFMPDNSVDSIVTDPPYGLKFMGKKWDYDVPTVELWAECLRVLKPGGYLLSFAGTRTQHRMAVRIEDAGFEIRDMIAWVYGSGFPKSMDVSKAIDKAAGAEREVVGVGKGRTGPASQPNGGSTYSDDAYQWPGEFTITAPATNEARQWEGWGTALKPALEPITVARKPLIGTVAANVLAHGTGGLNIDGCRVGTDGARNNGRKANSDIYGKFGPTERVDYGKGRWPTNLIHDGSEDVVALFPESKGQQGDVRGTEVSHTGGEGTNCYGKYGRVPSAKRGDTGSAARFFYCAKASKRERGEGNNHPTVKPIELMRYLLRLVTPPGGTALDPFMGSGSTGVAAILEGFRFIGVELDVDYAEIAKARIRSAVESTKG